MYMQIRYEPWVALNGAGALSRTNLVYAFLVINLIGNYSLIDCER